MESINTVDGIQGKFANRSLARIVAFQSLYQDDLNPGHDDLLACVIGSFQDGSAPGKMQFGTAWWHNDHKPGMLKQMAALASMGLLSRFVGMLTDSRSFLSYPRHEYFRRLLCDFLGRQMDGGEIPLDFDLVGGMVRDICYHNAVNFFRMED